MSLKGQALKRAYALGNRGKGPCSICGREIHNRMHMTDQGPTRYAHQGCVKAQQGNLEGWSQVW